MGATRTRNAPAGYRSQSYEQSLGAGGDVWQRAKIGLSTWVPHRGAGAEIVPADTPLTEGETLLVLLRPGPIWAVAPCRVVYVVDEPDRFGFAYGTLPGHPEQGEEALVVESDGERVDFRVDVFSRPVERLARLGAPVTRLIHRRVTLRYLRSLQAFVQGKGPFSKNQHT